MTDEDLEEMIRKVPKFLLNENGRLFKVKCENFGTEWACRVGIVKFKCGVCLRFEELYPK
jgi:hypothetical protein